MRKRNACWILAATATLATLVASCSPPTEVTSAWRDPSYTGHPTKLLVIGIDPREGPRRVFETDFARMLTERGIQATPAAVVIPSDKSQDRDAIRQIIVDLGFDAVLASRVANVERQTEYVPGATYAVPAPYYHGFYDYYMTSYAYVSDPGYYVENKIVHVETNMYTVPDAKLVWASSSETFNPGSTTEAIREWGEVMVHQLQKDGMLPGKK
jgi:hypothetical protein